MLRKPNLILALLSLIVLSGCAPAVAQPPASTTQSQTEPTVEAAATAMPTVSSAQPATESAWEIVLQREIEQPMRVAAFLDGDFGITGGPSDPGRAYYTTDGGQTWTMAESSVA
jgi:hypothetical protein